MKRLSGWFLALTTLTLATTALAQEVNVYSARHYDTDDRLYEAFKQQTGITVNVLEAPSDRLIQRIQAEGEYSPGDIFVTVDAGRLWRAEQAGILAPVDSEVLKQRIPARYRDPEKLWFGLTRRIRLIVYAKDRVDPQELQRYEDLADPQWRGRLCMRSSSNIYNQSLVASLIAEHGPEWTLQWAKDLVANFARPPAGADIAQIEAVAAGECDVSVINHYYLVRMLESDDPQTREIAQQVAVVFPNQDGRGAHTNISGAGLIKSAPHRENAVKFLEYLTTDEAQAIFARGNHEFPVVPGAPVDPVLEQWSGYKTDDVNVATLGELNPQALKLMDQAGWQ